MLSPSNFDLDQFLGNSVYYPCSGFDGTPVRFLGCRFQQFLYADYGKSLDDLNKAVRCRGFLGYLPDSEHDIPLSHLENGRTAEMPEANSDQGRFARRIRFLRTSEFTAEHGPQYFDLIYSNLEAIRIYANVYMSRIIAPKCLVYIRPGTAFGGNYNDYPELLERHVKSNHAGLPEFLLFDGFIGNPRVTRSWPLLECYQRECRWDYRTEGYGMANVTLASLK
jgi:hypothetical protein